MTQGVLSFKYECEKKNFGATASAGLLPFMDLLKKMDFPQMVAQNLRAKAGKQGWSDFHFLLCVLLLNLGGGDCVDDVKILEGDGGLKRIIQNLEHKNVFGRPSQKFSKQWRNGKPNIFPSASSLFRYLDFFHDTSEVSRRVNNKAFIPFPNANLLGIMGINQAMLGFLQLNSLLKVATIDMDASIVESQKEEALYSYKKCKGYQPLNAYWYEAGYMVHTEFRDGNVPAGYEQKRVFSEALSRLPQGVEHVYLRSDTAGYQHELLQYCERGENERFGRIEFAIGSDVTVEFKREVFKVSESEWHPLYKEVNGVTVKTGQEWAEIPFVPNCLCHSKKGRSYRYLGIREEFTQRNKSEVASQGILPFPTMELNNKSYKIFGLITNMEWAGEELIHWSRKRCGNSEHVHSEMKEALCGGQLPSGKFGSNAAWWWMMVLSLNIMSIMKRLALPHHLSGSRMKKIRYWLFNIPGRVIFVGKEMIVRLTRYHPAMDLLVNIRRRIADLEAYALG